jgi:hypothetical protein
MRQRIDGDFPCHASSKAHIMESHQSLGPLYKSIPAKVRASRDHKPAPRCTRLLLPCNFFLSLFTGSDEPRLADGDAQALHAVHG